jgi:uracil-DNA glycosylase
MFTGDRSGDWLYRALYEYGFASRPTARYRDDGLRLHDCYITAVLRCAPPENKPLPAELLQCRPFLLSELELLHRLRVVIALGRLAYDGVIKAIREREQLIHSSDPETKKEIPSVSSAHARELIVSSGLSTAVSGEKRNHRAHMKPPRFAHGIEIALTPQITVLASYHPSQQNTFTGKLTESMFHAVFGRARELLDGESFCG